MRKDWRLAVQFRVFCALFLLRLVALPEVARHVPMPIGIRDFASLLVIGYFTVMIQMYRQRWQKGFEVRLTGAKDHPQELNDLLDEYQVHCGEKATETLRRELGARGWKGIA